MISVTFATDMEGLLLFGLEQVFGGFLSLLSFIVCHTLPSHIHQTGSIYLRHLGDGKELRDGPVVSSNETVGLPDLGGG